MLVEIAGDVLTFQTLSRTGKRVDSGSIRRPSASESTRGRDGDEELARWTSGGSERKYYALGRQLNNGASQCPRPRPVQVPHFTEDVATRSHCVTSRRETCSATSA